MQLQKQMINEKIIFDRNTGKFMSKKQMIKFAEDFWEQGLRDDERIEFEKSIKDDCKEWGGDFDKKYLEMKIDYLLGQFNEFQTYVKTGKQVSPFPVWDGTDEDTWELVEMPQSIFGIFVDDDGEERVKRIKELVKWHKKEK